jgi:hypothetical protein
MMGDLIGIFWIGIWWVFRFPRFFGWGKEDGESLNFSVQEAFLNCAFLWLYL